VTHRSKAIEGSCPARGWYPASRQFTEELGHGNGALSVSIDFASHLSFGFGLFLGVVIFRALFGGA
jgi:hypothetical protein